MQRIHRDIIAGVCLLAVLASITLYIATGAKGYSRRADPEVAAMNEQSGMGDLFEQETGTVAEETDSGLTGEYAFGLAPGGPHSLDAMSVLTVAGPAVVIALAAHLLYRRGRKAGHSESSSSAQDESSASHA